MSAPDKLGWSFTDVGARAGPSPQRPFHTSVASGRLEQGDEGGGLEGGQSALGRLFLEVIHTTDSPLFPCTFGGNIFKAMFGIRC